MGAIAIAFDVVFAEPDRLSPDRIAEDNPDLPETVRADLLKLPSNEQVLADAIRRSRVIVGETSVRQDDQSLAGGRDIPDVPHAALGGDPTPYLLKFPRLVQNLPVISEAAIGRGMFTVEPDPDGIFRRVPLVMMVEDKIRLALSAEMLRIATGGQAFATRTGDAGLEGIVVGGVFVPTDGNGRVWPWFNGSSRDRYVSAGSVHVRRSARRQHRRAHGGGRHVGRRPRGFSRDAGRQPSCRAWRSTRRSSRTSSPSSSCTARPMPSAWSSCSSSLAGLFVIWLVPQDRRVLLVLRRRFGARHGRHRLALGLLFAPHADRRDASRSARSPRSSC